MRIGLEVQRILPIFSGQLMYALANLRRLLLEALTYLVTC